MAAGLGFKTFQTGEVLTAADTNGYLMQGVLVFANAAARDAAITSPQEGQCCYLKDTDAVLTYSGTAWVGFDDSNAIQNAIINAKGDLIAGSANDTPAILSAGANGETLVADSSTTTGLRYTENYAAGKNKIINGDFTINQRAFSSTTSTGIYGFDRWLSSFAGDGTSTMSAQTFTPGAAPVAGYEATNFVRLESTGQTSSATRTVVQQRIEDVRTFANQTVTVSFWAKASSGTPSVAANFLQNFGSGGSSAVNVNGQKIAITTSWARYSFTFNIPSISGKTLGASSSVTLRIWTSCGSDEATSSGSLGIQTATIDIWGAQVEAGSVATAFQTATGTLAGELAACQRYYYKHPTGTNNPITNCAAYSATNALGIIPFRVTMRTAPTLSVVTGTNYYQIVSNGGTDNLNSFTQDAANTDSSTIYNNTEVSQTAGHAGIFISNNASASIAWSAEL